jgi:hypothetical protein
MHPALLIDEILRHVFLFCFEDDRPSLVAAAQACKAWKDPALDFIWDRLSSFKPLLHLLPTFSKVDGEYVCPLFVSCLSAPITDILKRSSRQNLPRRTGIDLMHMPEESSMLATDTN